MSKNARQDTAGLGENPTREEVDQALGGQEEGEQNLDPSNPNQPASTLEESEQEANDRHIASTELPAGEVTDPDTQADTAPAEDAKTLIIPGAAEGPYVDGTVVNDQGKPAYAPPGSHNAAMNGVQQDAAGHVDSVGTDNSSQSGTRV